MRTELKNEISKSIIFVINNKDVIPGEKKEIKLEVKDDSFWIECGLVTGKAIFSSKKYEDHLSAVSLVTQLFESAIKDGVSGPVNRAFVDDIPF